MKKYRNDPRPALEKAAAKAQRKRRRPEKLRVLARHTHRTYESVRCLLYRDPEFAERIGMQTNWRWHTAAEYFEAIDVIARSGKVTQPAIGQYLGITQSAVSTFFKRNPAVREYAAAKNALRKKPPG